jgi:Type ISP C-terminal specificity domain/Eco57I restriction-modification methylase
VTLPDPAKAAADYLADCAEVVRLGTAATKELSYYPAVRKLIETLIAEHGFGGLTSPAARDDRYPDLAIYESDSAVLVLPGEVKDASFDIAEMLRLPQAKRYAELFGGGHVLLTNLWQFTWAELGPGGELEERETIALSSSSRVFESSRPTPLSGAADRLVNMLLAATASRPTIKEADLVARLLAHHAKAMVDAIEKTPNSAKLLSNLSDAFRDGLGMDLDASFFVSTVVQTLVYGLFAAWLEAENPGEFEWTDAAYHLRPEVLGALFHEISQPTFVKRCDLRPRLAAVSRVLRRVNRNDFEVQFENRAIEYFYEPFLTRFDPGLRDKLGVWYTPREIALYQVARIDRHLRREFELPDGLADPAVIILDPAVGTGTYLRAVIDHIYRHHLARGETSEVAASRARKDALTRIIGFEVLPAAFVISHLHLEHHLSRLHAPLETDTRLRVYLTNSLRGWGAVTSEPPKHIPGLEAELKAALEVKGKDPVLVILGNPPYHGYSAAQSLEERKLLSDWIEPLWKKWGLRKSRLGDLYVRFWRVAVRKIAEMTQRGVISFISNRKWLGGRSYPEMREQILKQFDLIVLDDLHGDVHDRSHPGDGSVFTTETAVGIQRGVAITTVVRKGGTDGTIAAVLRRDFRGTGAVKRAALERLSDPAVMDEGLEKLAVSKEGRWRLVEEPPATRVRIDEYFLVAHSGVQPVREEAVLSMDRGVLADRMKEYFDRSVPNDVLFLKHSGFAQKRKRYDPGKTRGRLLDKRRFLDALIVPFLYKPFDVRYLYWEAKSKLLNEPRKVLMSLFLGPDYEKSPSWQPGRLSIVCSQTPRRPGAARPALTSAVPGFHAVDPDARLIPRVIPSEGLVGVTPLFGASPGMARSNVAPEWIAAARSSGAKGGDLDIGDLIFWSVVGIAYSPAWAAAFGPDNDDYPPVPIPGELDVLQRSAELGRRVATLSDTLTDVEGVTSGTIEARFRDVGRPDSTSSSQLTAGTKQHGGRYSASTQTIFWNESAGWRNVPQRVWDYEVGGFQVLPKWLGYRHASRGHTLTSAEIEYVTMVCRRISTLVELESGADELFDRAAARPLQAEKIPAIASREDEESEA